MSLAFRRMLPSAKLHESWRKRRFSSIVITDEARHPVGILTERNILHAMRAASPPETPLRTCMSSPVVVMSGATNCLDAYQTCMREGIRHLVLVDESVRSQAWSAKRIFGCI